MAAGGRWRIFFHVGSHAAELPKHEFLTMPSDSALFKDSRTWRIESDQNRNTGKQRREENKQSQRCNHIEDALDQKHSGVQVIVSVAWESSPA